MVFDGESHYDLMIRRFAIKHGTFMNKTKIEICQKLEKYYALDGMGLTCQIKTYY